MKNIFTLVVIAVLTLIASTTIKAQNVGISSTTITPDPQAILELRSTDKGVLLPRMTSLEATSFSFSLNAGDDGMTVYDTDLKVYKVWNGSTLTWSTLATTGGGTGNTLDQAYDQGGAGVGKNITADNGAVRINGTDGLLVTGTFGGGNSIDTEVTGAGVRLFFNPSKAAFRAGDVSGNQWDDINIGMFSTASGFNTIASGISSIAMGQGSTASGNYSMAIGSSSVASSEGAVALAANSTASGLYSFTAGSANNASGFNSIAMGEATISSGISSFAIGSSSNASGDYSTAMGNSTTASGDYSTAIGNFSISSGKYSSAIGQTVYARSLAETTVGMFNTDYTPLGTGVYNAADRIFVVGNGQSSVTRSNALTILKDGKTGLGTSSPTEVLDVEGKIRMRTGATAGYVPVADANGVLTWTDPNTLSVSTNQLIDADLDTKIQVEESADEDIIRFDLAGTEQWVMQGARLEPMNSGLSVFIGEGAGANDDLSTNQNVFIGYQVGNTNTTGNSHTAMGNLALTSNTTGIFNTAIGAQALKSNTTGIFNTAIGAQALWANTIGQYNTVTGMNAMFFNTTGSYNTSNGYLSLNLNTTGSNNTASGTSSLYSNTTGDSNTANGSSSLHDNTTGSNNTASGFSSLRQTTTGSFNTGNGSNSLLNTTTGSFNIAHGYNALAGNTTGNNNTALGANADVTSGALTNATAIGYNAKAATSNSLVLGGTGPFAVNVGIGINSPTNELDVNGQIRMRTGATAGYVPVADANGVMTWTNPLTISGDINSVTAGNGLIGGGATGDVTLDVVASNGLTTNADDIKLGGALTQATTVTQGANQMRFNMDGTGDFAIQDNGVNKLFVGANGFVGISTSAPAYELEIRGDAKVTGVEYFGLNGSEFDGNSQGGTIELGPTNSAASETPTLDFHFGAGAAQDYNYRMINAANNRLDFVSSTGASVSINDGKVGIGTTAPGAELEIAGQIKVTGGTPGANKVLTSDASGLATWQDPNTLVSDGDWTITGSDMYSAVSGKVGVGTATPSAKLQVAATGSGNPDQNSIMVYNTTNAVGNDAIITARVAGSSAGDPFFSMDISGESGWAMGVDNDHGNRFKIANSWNDLSSNLKFTIQTDGKVGIGNDTPLNPLHVVAASTTDFDVARFDGSNTFGTGLRLNATAAGGRTWNLISTANAAGEGAGKLLFKDATGGNVRMVIESGGNVGVGTNTPQNNLHVHSAGSFGGLRTTTSGTGAAGTDGLTVGYNDAGPYAAVFNYENTPLQFATNSTFRMAILGNGNVGIGTSSPASILHVNTSQTGNVSKLHNPALGNGSLIGHEFGKANSTNNMAEFRYNHVSDGNAANYVNLGLWGNANTLTVTGGGNVGVGTTTPAAKLDVVGKTETDQLQVGNTGTTITSIQVGTATLGGNGGGGIQVTTISFPSGFGAAPKVQCTVRTQTGQTYTDTFAVTTKSITGTSFTVNVYRVDSPGGGWGQTLLLDWIAIE